MRGTFSDIFNFYLYSSIHISICAVAFTCYSFLYSGKSPDVYYLIWIGAGTCLLYSLHRIIGIDRVGDFGFTGRFSIIREHRSHLFIFAILSFILGLVAILEMPFSALVLSLLPILISLLYVLPMLPKGKRLRDIHFIKLFILSICWAWLTSSLPAMGTTYVWSISISRFFFIMGITIPFDVRDKEVDISSGVRTIAHILNPGKSALLAGCLVVLSLMAILLGPLPNSAFLLSEILVHCITIVAIAFSLKIKHDYYYSFFLDGTMAFFVITYMVISRMM